jgi:hypothetical protein
MGFYSTFRVAGVEALRLPGALKGRAFKKVNSLCPRLLRFRDPVPTFNRRRSAVNRAFLRIGALGLLAVVVAAAGPFVPARSAPPDPPAAPLPVELRYVPPDAALFVRVDVAALWQGELAKSLRATEKEAFTRVDAVVREFGVRLDDLQSLVWFVPRLKEREDENWFGLVLTLSKRADKDKFADGVKALAPPGAKVEVVWPSDKVAVVLFGLSDKYGKPQPAHADGPLTPALWAAASGKHVLVAGTTPANLPDNLRDGDPRGALAPLRPLFRARSVTTAVTLGRTLDLDVRATTARAADAPEVEKALVALAKLGATEVEGELPDLKKQGETDTSIKALGQIFGAVSEAAKKGKCETDGTTVRLTAELPLVGLPLARAVPAVVERFARAAAATRSAYNLHRIGVGAFEYEEKYSTFPPAAVCDKKGKPLLSWRVVILPYIGQEELYKQFKLDEPWDSAHNKKLLGKMPPIYALPGVTEPGETNTYYRVFVGRDTGWDWILGTPLFTITDGLSNTLMVATAAKAVPWTKPEELEFDPEKDMTKLVRMFNGRFQFATFDGAVHTLPKVPSQQTLHLLITKNDGQVIGSDF